MNESWCWRKVSDGEPHFQSKLDGNTVNENSVWDCRSLDGGGDPWALSPEPGKSDRQCLKTEGDVRRLKECVNTSLSKEGRPRGKSTD